MVKRVCQIIKVKPERFEEYCKVHDEVWPGVLAALEKAHFTDYSIHYDPIHSLLIANFKWTGEDWDADMEGVARDEETRRWWKMTDSMQESLVPGAKGSGEEGGWWLDLKEVFRYEGQA
ncbi:rhamnose mutarotase [Leucosporidium creatinivorum]|uniref:Rhamnose mutarotase n=1 Tax=Leucosporidium creatinivorum TaxID=106004 RepID=A0A1Y2F035_9BASI|nr:rhamnose mutarotase [Leucosporidium creatinivorum]